MNPLSPGPTNPSALDPDVISPTVDLRDQIPLAPARLWTRPFLILLSVMATIALIALQETQALSDEALPLIYWLSPLVITAVIALVRKLYLPGSPRQIRFHDGQVDLPRSPNSRRTTTLRLDEIRTIVPLVSRGQPAVVLDSHKPTQIYTASDFAHPELWRVFMQQVIERIGNSPDGFEQLRSMQSLSRLSQTTSSLPPTFTRRFLWIIAIIFAAQVFLSPPFDVLQYIYFGANIPSLVISEGQWWRIITANLLHGNTLHFAVNAFALFFLGTFTERLFGRPQTIVLILATAIAGALASFFFSGALASVGISTALYGLIGAFLALHLRFFDEIPPPYRQTKRWWVVILTLNLGLTLAVPAIDTFGHLGGLAAGLLSGFLLLRSQHHFRPRPTSGWLTNLAAAVLIALFAFSSAMALSYSLDDHPDDEIIVATTLLERADEENPFLLAHTTHQWTFHGTRNEDIDLILARLAIKSASMTDDPQIRQMALQTLKELAATTDADLPDYLRLEPTQR